MNRAVPLAALAALLLGGAITACGDAASSEDAARTDTAQQDSRDTNDPLAIPENNEYRAAILDGNGYGGPPQTVSMSCADKKTCDLVFIPPSDDTVRPFGLAVKLLRADEKQVVISVSGKQYVVKVGKAVKVKGATVKVVGTPGSVVTLNIRKT